MLNAYLGITDARKEMGVSANSAAAAAPVQLTDQTVAPDPAVAPQSEPVPAEGEAAPVPEGEPAPEDEPAPVEGEPAV